MCLGDFYRGRQREVGWYEGDRHELRHAAIFRGRDLGARHVVPDGVVFVHARVMVMRDALFQHAGDRARQRVRGGHLDPGQEEEQAASAAKKRTLHRDQNLGQERETSKL